jgi:hypothetical protein
MSPSTRTATLLIAAVIGAALPPTAAQAGEYAVQGADAWELTPSPPSPFAPGYAAPGPGGNTGFLVLRNSGGPGSAPRGAETRWQFTAPPGTVTPRETYYGAVSTYSSGGGWQATLLGYGAAAGNGTDYSNCPGGPNCGQAIVGQSIHAPALQIIARLRCNATQCARDQVYASVSFAPGQVVIFDSSQPNLTNARGDAWDRAYLSGVLGVTFDAADNVGIKRIEAQLDSSGLAVQDRVCNARAKTCPDWAGGTLPLDTRNLADGPHTLTLRAVDRADNVREVGKSVRVDNTSPSAPKALSVIGGDGWRPSNTFTLHWSNPAQGDSSPIAGAAYKLCAIGTTTDCVTGVQRGNDLNELELKLSQSGDFEASVWLIDAAGNSRPETAASPVRLGYDDDAPRIAIAPLNPEDPSRIRLDAGDATSPIARGELSLQRQGRKRAGKIRTIPAQITPDGVFATVDDERLPDGRYRLSARVADSAGNERSTNQFSGGGVAEVTFPIRLATTLKVGKPRRVHGKRRRGKRRHARTVYDATPKIGQRRRLRVYGRLTAHGSEPVANASVQVTSQLARGNAPVEPAGQVTTSRTGRFSYLIAAGASRNVAFRYAGAPKVRTASRTVAVGVRAKTTLRASRRLVPNGETVRFRGQTIGGYVPANGKLIELQFFARGKWRTFETVRTDPSGRWGYSYRFDGTRGNVRFRFRAQVPRETGYPYITGRSRRVRVTVRGR